MSVLLFLSNTWFLSYCTFFIFTQLNILVSINNKSVMAHQVDVCEGASHNLPYNVYIYIVIIMINHVALLGTGLLLKKKLLGAVSSVVFNDNLSSHRSIMPAELIPVSNGSSYETFYSVPNEYAASYRILVTTLLHAAKYK